MARRRRRYARKALNRRSTRSERSKWSRRMNAIRHAETRRQRKAKMPNPGLLEIRELMVAEKLRLRGLRAARWRARWNYKRSKRLEHRAKWRAEIDRLTRELWRLPPALRDSWRANPEATPFRREPSCPE